MSRSEGMHAVIACRSVRRLGAALLALVLVASHARQDAAPPIRRRSGSPWRAPIHPQFHRPEQRTAGLRGRSAQSPMRGHEGPLQFVPHEWDGIVRGSSITNTTPSCRRSRSRSGARRIAFSRRYYRVPPALIGRKDADLKQFGRRPSRASGSAPSTAANTRPTSNPYTRERNSGPTGTRRGQSRSSHRTARLRHRRQARPHAIPEHPRGLAAASSPTYRRTRLISAMASASVSPGGRGPQAPVRPRHRRADGRRNHDRIREKYFPFDLK